MIAVLLLIVILGVALWFIETYVPMAAPIKVLLRVVVVLGIVIYLLRLFGVATPHLPPL
jgi:hypothetical protein